VKLDHPTKTAAAGILLVLLTAACGDTHARLPPDPAVADQFLMERGHEAMAKKHWMDSREFFHQILDNYQGSPLRPSAKLALADSYLGEGSKESLTSAASEYREFMAFYPNDPHVDAAQFNLGLTFFKQMRPADRDQTMTKEALTEFDSFFQRFPNSPLTPQVRQKWRITRDRLSESSFDVGLSYFKRKYYPGAYGRFNEVLMEDPGYTHIDVVYYYLGETLARVGRTSEAIPLFDKVVTQYPASEYHKKADKRLTELKTPPKSTIQIRKP
jgi:outer membrane protein assembly factor BamD